MVLESLVVPEEWEKHPSKMFFIGFLYASIGLFFGLTVFSGYASIAAVFLTTMPLIVIMYKAIVLEEQQDLECEGRNLWCIYKTHGRIISFFMYLFIGLVVAYSFWFTVLSPDVSARAFEAQLATIEAINNPMSGAFIDPNSAVFDIWSNNLRVLFFAILFSFLYGAGAIFILTWNASVIGVAVGSVGRRVLEKSAGSANLYFDYFSTYSVSFSYAIHGLPEIAGYFLGALAGGIISVAVVNHDYKSPEFKKIVLDSLELFLASILLLLVSGILEVYVTPGFH
ncbi:MAG: stage II sporulation protein M [Candidatus Altiarchaeota archaeon]